MVVCKKRFEYRITFIGGESLSSRDKDGRIIAKYLDEILWVTSVISVGCNVYM